MKRLLLAALIPLLVDCGAFRAPANFDASDALAFHVNQVTLSLGALADVTIQANKQGLISNDEKLTILKAESTANKATKDLLLAVKAGASEPDAKAKAVAIIRSVLSTVPGQLSPRAQELIGPYIATVNTLLAVFA